MTTKSNTQENYIQYLYNEIDSLKQKLNKSELQCEKYCNKLKDSEKTCDLKEKFILFRESQLSEAEETIIKLKERLLLLSKKMSAEGSGSGSRPRPVMRPIGRGRSDSSFNAEITSLDTTPTSQLLEIINENADNLFRLALQRERPQNQRSVEHLKNLIARASELIIHRADSEIDRLDNENDDLQTENNNLQTTNDDLQAEITGLQDEINDLQDGKEELLNELDRCRRRNYTLEQSLQGLNAEFDDTEETDKLLTELAELEEAHNLLNERVNFARSSLFRLEETLTNTFKRKIFALNLTIARLQIELANAPINPLPPPPPPPQQQINQVWLLFQ